MVWIFEPGMIMMSQGNRFPYLAYIGARPLYTDNLMNEYVVSIKIIKSFVS